mgnify:CR=1 FL=1
MSMISPFKMVRCTAMGVGAAFCLVAFSETSFAQNLGAVMDRLERLERDIRTLNIQISRGPNSVGAKTPVSAAGDKKSLGVGVVRVTQRLDNLEQDIRSATGSMEQLGHQILQLTERLDKLVGDVDFRLSALEAQMRVEPSAASSEATPPDVAVPETSTVTIVGAPGAKMSGAPTSQSPVMPAQGPQTLGTVSAKAVDALRQQMPKAATATQQPKASAAPQVAASTSLPAGTPKEQYTYALNLLRQTNYDQAEIVLTEFIATQSKHSLAGNARYWLGETFYVRANYEQAAQTFFQGYQVSPSNVKAPDMLLKLGMSLAQLKKASEACATFDKLSQDFPQASKRIIRAVTRERKRAGC